MTGVGGRPEIVIEGANDIDGKWKVTIVLVAIATIYSYSVSCYSYHI